MTQRRERAARRRLVLLALPFVMALVLAAGLAWRAEQAARAHRATLERVVRDHADFAAFLLYRVAFDALERRVVYGFNPVLRYTDGLSLPGPDALAADPTEAERCAGEEGGRVWARWRAADGALELAGSPVDPDTREWLADTLSQLARLPGEERLGHAYRAGPGEPSMLSYAVLRDSTAAPIAVYAADGCFTIGDGTAFDVALDAAEALPPSLTGGMSNRELLAIRVTTPAGRTLYASSPAWLDGFPTAATGSASPDSLRGGATLHVTLRPDAVDRLVVGGMPPSRLPQALLLLAFAGALTAFAIVQAHRYLALVRMREQFTRNVSHELRTPLQQILLYADLLRLDEIREADDRRAALDTIGMETRRLIRLVNAVLQFARPADANRLRPVALPLAAAARETVVAFEPFAREGVAVLRTELEHDPAVTIELEAFRQILINLLDNAVKFGPAGQTVTVRVAVEDQRAVLTVDDEGMGIPPHERRAVLEAYHRLDRDAGRIPGSGIGLTIVDELARASGGTLDLTDRPGGGTRARVSWPLSEAR